ncbi:uncharacterized protein RCO7_14274 [Rhynchosporium graminicola]|uniref:Uncharacterized protein n=2 Tax=Rhynchosporium TaxID=38037 RepID=A0A1E1MLS0_RHYSE|nr:uncharacterized protein RCO7_14274 [Rhynchosporium commune]CZT50043.1 uncharacterized protein RSE6_10964 [Rhynchosporium secalis]
MRDLLREVDNDYKKRSTTRVGYSILGIYS